ncbi:RAD51-associated protein 1 isoform X1 [Paralichthys olivaceus]|uniref:RAD51-associated protein 1 isoform X1 n=1 Tax=Paralichthys olivaceus TaxID=8255 RepID=UPI003751B8B3
MDRPSRKTKTVNYREPNDCDDDDDFACAKAPPRKKARDDVKQQEHMKSSSKASSQENNSQSSQKSRRPLDERLCERDLEAAITLSLLNNAEEVEDQSPTSKDIKVPIPLDENTDPSTLHLSNCSVNAAILGLDEITSEKVLPASSRQRKAPTEEQRKNLKEEDDDYQPKLTPDSESDEDFSEADESEDEEFTVKKVSKTKKKENVPKKIKSPPASKKEKQQSKTSKSKSVAAAASTPVRNHPAPKFVSKRPASSPTLPTFKPVVSLSPAGGRIPKWNPPGQMGKSPTSSHNPSGKSPGQGLRLGLSRHVRVKPLHPSVTSH